MQIQERLDSINWDDQELSCQQSQEFLKALYGERSVLRALIDGISGNSDLREKCEKYDLLTKLVLYEAPSGARLRLHIFHGGYFDRPHNHRWLYTSNILHGSYVQTLFRSGKGFLESNVSDLELVFTERREENAPYSLNTNIFHSITASEPVVTLIIRGPAASSEFRVMDRNTGQSWSQRGAKDESPTEISTKRLSDVEFKNSITFLEKVGVIH